MTFEEALRQELAKIEGIKVYPLFAPKSATPPFLVYRKGNVKFKKTLSGTSSKADGIYDIVLISGDYGQLQQLADNTKEKLLSFQSRVIGEEGPFIDNVTVEYTGDEYEHEADLIRSNINLQIKY